LDSVLDVLGNVSVNLGLIFLSPGSILGFQTRF